MCCAFGLEQMRIGHEQIRMLSTFRELLARLGDMFRELLARLWLM